MPRLLVVNDCAHCPFRKFYPAWGGKDYDRCEILKKVIPNGVAWKGMPSWCPLEEKVEVDENG